MNINTVHQTLSIITDGVFEIRVMTNKYRYSGIFDDIDKACKTIEDSNIDGTYCVTLNRLSTTVTQLVTNKLSVITKNNNCCVNDTLVDNINWLFIDIDPDRPPKTSSTDEQLEEAKAVVYDVKDYLTEIGFAEPLIAMSGNGYHLLYKVDMENTVQNKKRIKLALELLHNKFKDRKAKVDTANSNPSRLCKLYGTNAVKGTIHRESTIISVPKEFKINNVDLLVPLVEESTIVNNGQIYDSPKIPYTKPIFNDWLDYRIEKYCIPVVSTEIRDGIMYYHLAHCVHNADHNADITRKYNPNTGLYNGVPNYRCYNANCNHNMKDMWDLYGIVQEEPKTVLTYAHLGTICKHNNIDIHWDIIGRILIIDGKMFKTKERATLVRTLPQVLKEILYKANYTAITNDNIQETIIVHATNNARNEVRELLDTIQAEKTGELKHLCDTLKLSNSDAQLLHMWLKQAYCMMFNDSDSPYSLDFGLICENPQIEYIMTRLALLDDFHKVCTAPHSEHNFTTRLLTTSWFCRLHSIPPKRKDWVTGICAAPYVIDTMPYKDVKIQFPHRTSYYSTDTDLLDISDFWQLLTIPEDIDLDEVMKIDYVKVWSDVKYYINQDHNFGYNNSNCFKIEHMNYNDDIDDIVIEPIKKHKINKISGKQLEEKCKPKHATKQQGLIASNSPTAQEAKNPIKAILKKIFNNCPYNKKVVYKDVKLADFMDSHKDELCGINNIRAGKLLVRLGYTPTTKSIKLDDGSYTTVKIYNLPCWEDK